MLLDQGDDSDRTDNSGRTTAEHDDTVSSQSTNSALTSTWTTVDSLRVKHQGYVSGQRVNGTLATVIGPHDHSRFVAYIPRCECGWTGPCFSPTLTGYAACQHLWEEQHLRLFVTHPDSTAPYALPAIGAVEDLESIAAHYLDDI